MLCELGFAALPDNPHSYMDAEGKCSTCHAGNGDPIDPHNFSKDIPDMCWECHSKEKLGRSHPLGVDPANSNGHASVKDNYLRKSDPQDGFTPLCLSCHTNY